MNALTLLKQDHGNLDELFRRFEHARPDDTAELARVRDLVVEHLSRHTAIEEEVFYPAVLARLAGRDGAFPVLEGLEEHHIAKWTLSELAKMAPGHARFRPKMKVLIEQTRHHVREEEEKLFVEVRDAFTVEELNDLGDRMEALEPVMPTRPHPRIPDTAPLNLLIGVPLAVLDGAVSAGKEAVGRLVHNGGR
jgi:hemerythrin-like domain-containing protein